MVKLVFNIDTGWPTDIAGKILRMTTHKDQRLRYFGIVVLILSVVEVSCINRSFVVDYEKNQFLMDGEPFRYVAAEMHYFRVPAIYWTDRFAKIRAGGLNAVQTYIEWSKHEPEIGKYNFEDNLDFVSFIQSAGNSSLYVLVRSGPYICGARDMGGLPFWLMQQNPNVYLRTVDPSYLQYVDNWLGVLLPKLKPLLYENGGPIIGIQVENEYGSYPACDMDYVPHLRDIFRSYLGDTAYLYTTDGGDDYYLKCGKTEGLYATVDFGPGSDVAASFASQRRYEPSGPLVNSEYYPGWDDNWGYPHSTAAIPSIQKTLLEMLSLNASVSMYMFAGGTSFGFSNGAVLSETFSPYITSYDYNAPISEAGDTTIKFMAIRETISKFMPVPSEALPQNTTKYAYGTVNMEMVGNFFDLLPYVGNSRSPVTNLYPLTFEFLGQAYGFVLYETIIKKQFMVPSYLSIPGIADRGYVFLDAIYVGIVSRINNVTLLPLQAISGQRLSILVENQGRLDYGIFNNDSKGINGNVTLDGQVLIDWNMTQLPLDDTHVLDRLISKSRHQYQNNKGDWKQDGDTCYYGNCLPSAPAVYTGGFYAPSDVGPQDTFLNLPGWSKGVAFINGFNLGRYWPSLGPQWTLFVPKNLIKANPDVNVITVFELEYSPCSSSIAGQCVVQLIDYPILNAMTPYMLSTKVSLVVNSPSQIHDAAESKIANVISMDNDIDNQFDKEMLQGDDNIEVIQKI